MKLRIDVLVLAAFSIFIALVPQVPAQYGRIEGVVKYTYKDGKKDWRVDGKLVEDLAVNVVIQVKREGQNEDFGAVSPEGKFIIKNLVAGPWRFEALQIKAATITKIPSPPTINVPLDGTANPEIKLVLRKEDRTAILQGKMSIVLALYRPLVPTRVPQQDTKPQEPASAPICLTELTGVVNVQQRSLDGEVKRSPLSGVQVVVRAIDASTMETFILDSKQTDIEGRYKLNVAQLRQYSRYIVSFNQSGYESEVLVQPCNLPVQALVLLKTTAEVKAVSSSTAEPEEEALATPPLEMSRRYAFFPRVMQSLPISGYRSFDEFALLAPGVLPSPQTFGTYGPGVSPGIGTAGQFSVNGIRSRENNFTVDGSDNNDEDIGTRRQGFVSLTLQPIETLQEFQVITALADARYGRTSGGQINALTQSGSVDFHFSLYGFFTSNRFNATDFFDQTTKGGPATFALTRAGDNAPVLVDGRPVVQANPVAEENSLKRTQVGLLTSGRFSPYDTFFFGSVERKSNRESRESHFAVPDIKQRGLFDAGDTGLLANGAPIFPSSIPGDAIFSLYPFPNNSLGPYGANTYTSVLPANADATLFTIKINQRFGKLDLTKKRFWSALLPIPRYGDLLTGRYNFTQDRNQIPTMGGALFSSLRPRIRTQNYAFYLNRQFSNKTFDTIRFSFGRTKLFLLGSEHPEILPSDDLPNTPFLLNAPLLLNVTAPNADGTLNPPSFVSASSLQGRALLNSLGYGPVTHTEHITGPLGEVSIPGFSPIGIDVLHFPQTRANNTIQAGDTVSHIRDNHAFTFGGEMRKAHINSTLDRNFRPIAQFSSLRSSSAPLPLTEPNGTPVSQQFLSGTTLAAAGVPTGFFHTIGGVPDSSIGIRYTQVSFFGQDEWSIRPNFRWTLGIRYETNSLPDTVGHRLENAFDPSLIKQLAEQAASTCQPRCSDLVQGLTRVFPSDFKESFAADRNDFDVRFGFAYDVGSRLRVLRSASETRSPTYDWSNAGKMVIRGGFGLYSGQFPGIVLSQSRNAFPNFLPLNLANFSARSGDRSYLFNLANPRLQTPNGPLSVLTPATLNTIQSANTISVLSNGLLDLQSLSLPATALGLDLVLPQRSLKTASVMQYGIITENRLLSDYYFSFSYVGTRSLKLLRVSTPDLGTGNARVNFTQVGTLGSSPFPFFSGSASPAQANLISNSFAVARTFFESSANSTYNSLQFELRRRFVNNLQLSSALTYSHSTDDASDFFDTAGAFALPQSSVRRSENASSGFDVRWRWVTYFILDLPEDLPFTRSKTGKGLGGWRFSGILTAQTGQPFTINSAFDVNRDGNLTDRLNRTDGVVAVTANKSTLFQIAPGLRSSDLLASDGRDGVIGRNTYRAPGIFDLNFSVTKNLNFNEKHKLYLRTEIFNVFNRTHFAIPERILESPGFGKAVRTILPARTIQFAMKYSFGGG